MFARKQFILCFELRHKSYLTQTLCYTIRDSFCLGTLLGCHLAASARMLVGLSLNRSHHGQRCWTDLGVIMDNCLLAIVDDLVEKHSSPISDPNMFKMSKFGAYEFNFVLQASRAIVLSKWRRNAWRTPETSAWETNLVLINWMSYYISKAVYFSNTAFNKQLWLIMISTAISIEEYVGESSFTFFASLT